MIGDASEFTPLDLLGTLAINAGMSHLACTHKSGSFRVGIASKKTGDIPAYADFRFLGGVGSALAASFGGPMVRRLGHDLATGLLGSYVSTETCRRQALKRIELAENQSSLTQSQGMAQSQITAQAQIPPQAQAQAVPVPADDLAGDYDW